MEMKKLIIGITAPGSVILIKGQLKYFKEQGYETYLMAPDDVKTRSYCENEGCTLLAVPIEREISVVKDFKSLLIIFKHIRRIKPDVVNVGTPKMGLLGMICSKLLGVKKRIYTCRGFRFEQEKWLKRNLLFSMEKIAGLCAHSIICISPSLQKKAIELNVFNPNKTNVINKGSSNGINLDRFKPELINELEKQNLKQELKISTNFCFGFVGRLVDDKGINELYYSFESLNNEFKNTRLLIVGPIEANQIVDKSILDKINLHPAIISVGSQSNIPLYLSLMDVFVLPTYREGFGNAFLEAAAMGLPIIGTNVVGARDAVCPEFNGLLVEAKNIETLNNAMKKLYLDEELRKKFGINGIIWSKNFERNVIWKGIQDLYIS